MKPPIIVIKDSPNFYNTLKRYKALGNKGSTVYALLSNKMDGIRKVVDTKKGITSVMPPWGPLLTEGEVIPDTTLKIIKIVSMKIDLQTRYFLVVEDLEPETSYTEYDTICEQEQTS